MCYEMSDKEVAEEKMLRLSVLFKYIESSMWLLDNKVMNIQERDALRLLIGRSIGILNDLLIHINSYTNRGERLE